MITLEQIKQLESKITRALELIKVLRDENSTLRRGLESAQKRMKELETLVDGFKTDQREIESVIVRTLRNLDELEDTAVSVKKAEHAAGSAVPSAGSAPAAPIPHAVPAEPAAAGSSPSAAQASTHSDPASLSEPPDERPPKEELDIF
jgi:peptidoglycan hydrolase CwlO-like protein